MLGVLIFCVLLGIFIIVRAYTHPIQPIEYTLTLILLICLLWSVVLRPIPIYSTTALYSVTEPFTQALATLDTKMLSDVAQLPTTIRSQVTNGMNYLIQVQEKVFGKNGGSRKMKNAYLGISKDTLEEPNLSDEDFQRIGKEYILLDNMLNSLEANHEGIYKSIMVNVKVVDPYDAAKQQFGLEPVVQEEYSI